MNQVIKLITYVMILVIGVISLSYSIILYLEGFRTLLILKGVFEPKIVQILEYRSEGMTSTSFNEAIGIIDGEQKFLILSDSAFAEENRQYEYYVFSAKGEPKLFPRKKDELVFDKTPFKKRLPYNFIFPLIINPILWILWRRISRSLNSDISGI